VSRGSRQDVIASLFSTSRLDMMPAIDCSAGRYRHAVGLVGKGYIKGIGLCLVRNVFWCSCSLNFFSIVVIAP
jgi:hypothetical protein